MNASPATTIDWARVRADFPLLTREVHGTGRANELRD